MAVSSVLTNMRQGQKGDPTSAVSAVKQVQQREALGRSVGIQHQIHLRCDGNGLPITFKLTVGERHEAVVFEPLMELLSGQTTRSRTTTVTAAAYQWRQSL